MTRPSTDSHQMGTRTTHRRVRRMLQRTVMRGLAATLAAALTPVDAMVAEAALGPASAEQKPASSSAPGTRPAPTAAAGETSVPTPASTNTPATPGSPAPPAAGAPEPSRGEQTRSAAVNVFAAGILAGGAVNVLVVDVQSADMLRLPEATLKWRDVPSWCANRQSSPSIDVLSKALDKANNSKTQLAVFVPGPPCSWPPYQYARITVGGIAADRTSAGEAPALFDGTVRVSVRWFPLAITVSVLSLIYPGCALIAWFLSRRRYQKAVREHQGGLSVNSDALVPPDFWDALDPVQMTANVYGRASLAKLQTFGFSLTVFGLLLYYQLRNGILSGLSEDVLILLGISAVGTVGGRITYTAKRRLSLDN